MAENWDVVENTIEIGDGEVGIFISVLAMNNMVNMNNKLTIQIKKKRGHFVEIFPTHCRMW